MHTETTPSEYEDIPLVMRQAKRWLLHKNKIPHYVTGEQRHGQLDSLEDQARLATFEDAVSKVNGIFKLGFALGPDGTGSCWQGIDLDKLSEHPALSVIVDELPGYTETSPSGNGLHAIGYGRQFKSLGSNTSGIEAYSSGRYFTMTGEEAGLHDPVCIADFVEKTLIPMHSTRSDTPDAGEDDAHVIKLPDETLKDLRSALTAIDADDRAIWIRMGNALKELGKPGGTLWVEYSQKSDSYDAHSARVAWDSFKPHSIHYQSVFEEAKRTGWVNPKEGYKARIEDKTIIMNDGVESSLIDALRGLEVTMDAIDEIADATFILPNLLTDGAVTGWKAPHESGKTALARYAANEAVKQGYEVFYFDVDSPAFVAKEMKILAVKEGWRYFNPDIMIGQSVDGYLKLLEGISKSGSKLGKMLFIFDTEKKFTESIISKTSNKKMTTLMRSLAVRGAAVLILGHTNKFRDKEANLTPEGTNEVMTDVDTLLIFETVRDNKSGVQHVSSLTEKDQNPYVKNRFAFEPVTFEITLAKYLEDRKVYIRDDYMDLLSENQQDASQESDLEVLSAIRGAMFEIERDGAICMQQKIVLKVSGFGKNKIRDTLDKYEGVLWTASFGVHNSKIYKLKEN